jgi:condensin-2 complex subunit G2
MLVRLYEPILWRALRAANPIVRRNAVGALANAFPLQTEGSGRGEADALLSKQV